MTPPFSFLHLKIQAGAHENPVKLNGLEALPYFSLVFETRWMSGVRDILMFSYPSSHLRILLLLGDMRE